MPSPSIEDTIIEARPKRAFHLFAEATDAAGAPAAAHPLERCRTLFREIGERVSSFDLSRQIYG